MITKKQLQRLQRNRKGLSPAISTVIITSAVVVMVLVAMVYANTFLDSRLAENEFVTNKQFMLTTGLQIDDIAWTMGRAQTVRYSSNYGQVNFEETVLRYSIEVDTGSGFYQVFEYETGVILFNMPTNAYTLGNDYFERILPASDSNFVQEGPSAPINHIYVIEKIPMEKGPFIRVAIVPTIRMLNSKIGSQDYVKFYVPSLNSGESPRHSQSITLIGDSVTRYVEQGVNQVRITASFPSEELGFDSDFYKFENNVVTLDSTTNPVILAGSIVEFYSGEVTVSLGLYM